MYSKGSDQDLMSLHRANKIKTIVDNTIDGLVKFRIPVAKSTTLYVMVDPVGCLAPNEIYVQVRTSWLR